MYLILTHKHQQHASYILMMMLELTGGVSGEGKARVHLQARQVFIRASRPQHEHTQGGQTHEAWYHLTPLSYPSY